MAIFTKNGEESNRSLKGATIIAECTTHKGEIETECTIHIDGVFEGQLNSKSVVIIGKKGHVKGQINSQGLIVSGLFEGNVEADRIEILDGGLIKGETLSHQLIIETNGFLEGTSSRKPHTIEA